MPSILVPIAAGFEEIEAITIIDVLRRAGCEVTSAGLQSGEIVASRKTRHLADTLLEAVIDQEWDAIVLPGGRPGADHLADHTGLIDRMRRQEAQGKLVAAICAAPLALDRAGILSGRKFTCHPTASGEVKSGRPELARVVYDRGVLTSQSAGTAMEFAMALVSHLCGEGKVEEIEKGLITGIGARDCQT